ncbi:actin cytoskeleton-regulatory complex protein PAN1 [Andrographis paniculata]|uniref:actin cytoskeleton-regulatory complex protein PAN1 n=1 Tax=Andrographis paniculata TaxID=175694 RepID=UPI0021E981FB|nr:actin cytoskeleton-regulatory complex protein PAN1 [Andrographis paniculata]
MLRRSVLQLASRGSSYRIPLRTATQIPSYLSSRRAFSVSQKTGPHKPGLGNNTPEQQSSFPKILTGGLALGSVFFAAYYYGLLDRYLGNLQPSISETKHQIEDNRTQKLSEQQNLDHQTSETISGTKESDISIIDENLSKKDDTNSGLSIPENSIQADVGKNSQSKHTEDLKPENIEQRDIPQINPSSENVFSVERREMPCDSQSNQPSDDINRDKSAEENLDIKNPGLKPGLNLAQGEQAAKDAPEGDGSQKSKSLLDDYLLRESFDESSTTDSKLKDIGSMIEYPYDGFITKDGKLVLDFLQAIHAAEERQAQLDARSFSEEKRTIKEKYEKELKDARVRELMYAEREAILEKELSKERVKAAVALKSLQEKLEEKLKTELEQKEREAEQKQTELQEIAKAELSAAIAREKASQIERMAEADLHINALCMAFFARSEEARQNNSVHKLALGALSLEDALSKGMPIQKEIEALHTHIEGIDNDSLIALVLSSLPEDTQKYGTDTMSNLNHKFDALKGTLRHFSLIPPGGGGILTHSLAHVASWLKVQKVDESGDGIESLIHRVENLLAQGKLCEAADMLENGVKGSKAAEVVDDWVRQARNRAITEQALTVLHSYATSISLT